MIRLQLLDGGLIVLPEAGDFRPRHESQLAYWGFVPDPVSPNFVCATDDIGEIAIKVVGYFEQVGLTFSVDPAVQEILGKNQETQKALRDAFDRCTQFKSGHIDTALAHNFEQFARGLSRPLKEHQFKAALHLICAKNGANFSVPGSGKTSVVLAVFEKLRREAEIDSLFVVGPPACFAPWRLEYAAVLGREPTCGILAGGNIDDRRARYLVDGASVPELFLTTFQTLQRDVDYVRALFQKRGVRFFFVVDEAHYIKQIGGVWATAVLDISRHAAFRCVLTGTPFPRTYVDAFNLFEVLWPDNSPMSVERQHRIEIHLQHNERSKAAELLEESIGPLFYRVRKSDLHLAPQEFCEPVRIRMNQFERLVYDSILDRIEQLSHTDYLRDLELLARLRKGRMVRLRQCISYAALMRTAVAEYNEDLLVEDPSLADIVYHYDTLERPAKLEALEKLIKGLRRDGEKVVVWSNFVRTLELITNRLSELGHGVRLIYGGTPFENASVEEEATREGIIRQFVQPSSGVDILVANPAACAESISLHKACSHAVYYDLSYNCAQYLQSLDRIHRVGGSENKTAYYHFLQYVDSIDPDILMNVKTKAHNMSAVIDHEYPVYSLDMFGDDEELEAYDRVFPARPHRVRTRNSS
jgi:SNF2-related domain/Helicase conserved C-terminal domain